MEQQGSAPPRPPKSRAADAVLTGMTAVSAMLAFLCGAIAGRAWGSLRLSLLVVGAVFAGGGALAAAIQRRRDAALVRSARQVAEDAQVEFALTLNGALAPLTAYLGEVAIAGRSQDRDALGGRLAQAAVDAAVRVTAPATARSAFYELAEDGDELVRETYAGRPHPPRSTFRAGTPDGDFVLDLVHAGDILLVDDVDQHPLVVPSPGSGYRSVIAASVRAGAEPLGLLTVDVPVANGLTDTHVEIVRVLANLLGAGLADAWDVPGFRGRGGLP